MAVPNLTVTPDKSSYLPNAPVVFDYVAMDPDNSTEVFRTEGTDSQDNPVQVDTIVTRIDPFTVTRAYWVRTGQNASVDPVTRKITTTMPSV